MSSQNYVQGLARCGWAWLGQAWHGLARRGSARQGSMLDVWVIEDGR